MVTCPVALYEKNEIRALRLSRFGQWWKLKFEKIIPEKMAPSNSNILFVARGIPITLLRKKT